MAPDPDGWFERGTVNVTVSIRVVFDTQGGTGGPLVTKVLTLHNWPRALLTFAVPIALFALAYRRRHVVRVKEVR